jgi:phage baseplate assembly protein W
MAIKTYVWSDTDGEYGEQVDGDVIIKTDVQAIINSLNNIINTRPGSRRMLPTFASTAWWLLFEPIDDVTALRLAESILEAIEIWEDRIDVTGFDIEARPDESMYRCRLSFTVIGSDEIEQIDFVLSR